MFGDFALGAGLMALAYALAALALVFLIILPWLDRRLRHGTWKVGTIILQNPMAAAVYLGARLLAVCLLVGMLAGCSSAQAADTAPSPAMAKAFARYAGPIDEAVKRYWSDLPGDVGGALWAAQLWQESRLNPAAVSPVGAAGLAQFMPGTWRDAIKALGLSPHATPHDEIAIAAGAWYMAKMRAIWSAQRPVLEKHWLGLASYNAGGGNIIRAQARCGGAKLWASIAPCLALVTGARNAHETTTYVMMIRDRWWPLMVALR